MASPKPQVIVRREFEALPDVSAQPLNACIIGPSSRVASFMHREDLIEALDIAHPVDAPEYSGHIQGEDADRVTRFNTTSEDLTYGAILVTVARDTKSVAASVATGYTIQTSSVKLHAENAFVRLMSVETNEVLASTSGGLGSATQAAANVVDCGISTVSKPGYPRSTLLLDDAKVGDQVYIEVKNNSTGVVSYYVTAIIGFQTETTGQIKKIVLANNVFLSLTDTVDALSIRRRVAEIANIPEIAGDTTLANWRYRESDRIVYYGGVTDAGVANTLGADTGLLSKVSGLGTGWVQITSATMYISYTAYRTDLPMEVSTIESLSDITDLFGTDLHPGNLLGWAIYTAKLNAGGQPVYYIPTPDQQLTSYVAALAQAETERGCYSIVPLTEATDVLAAVEGHVDNMSAPEEGKFRIGWFAPEITRGRIVTDLNGSDTLTVSDPNDANLVAGTSVVRVTSSVSNHFQDARVGAIIYFQVVAAAPGYDQHVSGDYSAKDRTELLITSVLNNDEVECTIQKLNSESTIVGEASGSVSSITIDNNTNAAYTDDEQALWEEVTGNVLAQEYATTASGFDNERIFAVVPDRGIDGMRVDGESVKNVHLAAAFAGLRSTSAVQQPISNVTVNGFDTLNAGEILFSEANFSTMRDAGVWIVRQPRTGGQAGKIFAQRQLSTNNLDIYRKEQSVTTNVDNIAFSLLDGLNIYVGRVNITAGTIGRISRSIDNMLRAKTSSNSVDIGPQLLAFEIVTVEQVAASLGTLKVQVTLDVPLPMNVIDLTLVI